MLTSFREKSTVCFRSFSLLLAIFRECRAVRTPGEKPTYRSKEIVRGYDRMNTNYVTETRVHTFRCEQKHIERYHDSSKLPLFPTDITSVLELDMTGRTACIMHSTSETGHTFETHLCYLTFSFSASSKTHLCPQAASSVHFLNLSFGRTQTYPLLSSMLLHLPQIHMSRHR